MDVNYNKLFKMLIDKGMKKKDFREKVEISESTMAKLSNNENVSLEVIARICRAMECSVDDIMDILPDKTEE